jgi:hypothetical protein
MKAHFAGTDLSSCNDRYRDIPKKAFLKLLPVWHLTGFYIQFLLRNVLRF